jgi:MOSC domain-containing protein YiiM
MDTQNAHVLMVSKCQTYAFSKPQKSEIHLQAGLGVEGDAHNGVTVKHRHRMTIDPTQPNLRQVHLIHAELFDELNNKGFTIVAGALGENITTKDIDLLNLPCGTHLHIGDMAVVEVTGLRHPCKQLNDFQPGLMNAVLYRDSKGDFVRKAGIMGVVKLGGRVKPGDSIQIELPPGPHEKLHPV